MKTICILSQSHLCRNPRVLKEATTLAKAGYRVTVLTTFTHHEFYQQDLKLIESHSFEYRAAVDLRPGEGNALYSLQLRLQRRIATELNRRYGIENRHSLGYGGTVLLREAKKLHADLYIAHQEQPTWAGCELMRQGYRVAFDFEDWYSQDLLPEAQKNRPLNLLKNIEKQALKSAAAAWTTSEALAAGVAEYYGVSKPAVIYNAFSWADRNHLDGLKKDRKNSPLPSLFWFSQTIGEGRGLERLVTALANVNTPVALHLRGTCPPDYRARLEGLFPTCKGHQLFIHELVSTDELLSRIAEHDVGLALEEQHPPSRNLTITNKILQYLLAGIPVVASATAGQREVAAQAREAVLLFEDDAALARCIENALSRREMAARALEAARQHFCWEQQEKTLLALVNTALNHEIT